MTVRFLALSFVVALGLSGCDSNPNVVDISQVEIAFNARNFGADLMGDSTVEWHQKNQQLAADYPQFYPIYVEDVMNLGLAGDPSLGLVVGDFATNRYVREIYREVEAVFSPEELGRYMAELEDAFKRYRAFFPAKEIPQVVTYISGLRQDVMVDDGLLGISLDWFLGSEYARYTQMGHLSQYQIDKMNPSFMNVYAMKCWMAVNFQPKKPSKDMLDYMVQHGKLLYAASVLFPKATPAQLNGYTAAQVEWCVDNEFQVYAHFVEKNLFYSLDEREIIKYIGEGPFTSGFPKESPSAIGIWMGWKIVDSFMKKTGSTLTELMAMEDAKVLFETSGYKPKL